MKIFLDEKSIELLDKKPGNVHDGAKVVEYSTSEQLGKDFREFEKDAERMRLVVWSERGDGALQHDFRHLFKRVDAGGGLVKNEKGEVLFIFRLGKWDLPKGKLSGNETPEEGAIREVREETGLRNVRITGALPPSFHIYTRKGKQILKQTWWFEMAALSEETLVPQAEEDITGIQWTGRKDLEHVLLNTYGSIREVVLSAK
jgi:8-oxo-(d)GTP phosphatase